jgi:tetratricopeptide (TPR) repeat protein
MVTNPAGQYFKSGYYNEAVEAYRRQLREGPGEELANMAGLADSLMAAGQFGEAIPYLEKLNEYRHGLLPGNLGLEIELSVSHWMADRRAIALDIIKGLVIDVRDGKVEYSDIAGGVTQGLILCYMAITLCAKSDVDLGMKFLNKLATRSRIQYWPGPAALFLLGGLTFADALRSATSVIDLVEARRIAEQDLMKRRHLTALLFAAGTERRMAGDEAGCRMFMVECASLTNPLVEYEWYLAKSEIESST